MKALLDVFGFVTVLVHGLVAATAVTAAKLVASLDLTVHQIAGGLVLVNYQEA